MSKPGNNRNPATSGPKLAPMPPWGQQADTLYRVQTGIRTESDAEHPIENIVEQDGRRWKVTYDVCNGTAGRVEHHKTKQAALAAANRK